MSGFEGGKTGAYSEFTDVVVASGRVYMLQYNTNFEVVKWRACTPSRSIQGYI